VYELLFRSRWYALGWALLMATSAIAFTTTGIGAWLTGTSPDSHASEDAREHQFQSWTEDAKRRLGDDQGYDPSSPDLVRDGTPQRANGSNPQYRTVPFSADDAADEKAENGPDAP